MGVALGIEQGDVAYVPVGHDTVGAPAQLTWTDFIGVARSHLEDAAIAKTGQDLKAAKNMLARYGVDLLGIAHDTMLESYVLDSVGARRHSLEDIAGKYLGANAPSFEAIAGKGASN